MSKLRIAAWIGVAATLAVLTAGAIFGLSAESRADEINRRLSFVDTNNQPHKFDQSMQSDLQSLKDDGNMYNGLAIGFYSVAARLGRRHGDPVRRRRQARQARRARRTRSALACARHRQERRRSGARRFVLMRRLVSIVALALAAASGSSGCFNVDKPTCSYACSDTMPKCPDDYTCSSDGYCHLDGTTAACAFSDAAVQLDLSLPDLVSTPD